MKKHLHEMFPSLAVDTNVYNNTLLTKFNSWRIHGLAMMDIGMRLQKSGSNVYIFEKPLNTWPSYFNPYFRFQPHKWEEFGFKACFSSNDTQNVQHHYIGEAEAWFFVEKVRAAKNRKEISNLSLKGFPIGYAIVSTLVSKYGIGELNTTLIRRQGTKLAKEYIQIVNQTYRLILKNAIDLIVVFNGRFCEENAVAHLGTQLGIKVLYHEAPANGKEYFLFDAHALSQENFALVLNRMKKSWTSEEIFSKGNHWIQNRMNRQDVDILRFQKKWNSDMQIPKEGKCRITFFPTSDDEFLGVNEAWDLPNQQSQFERCLDFIRGLDHRDYEVIVRLHPNLASKSKSLQRKWMSLSQVANARIIEPGANIDSYKLVKESDLVVTCGSTIAVEAGILGVPVLAIGSGIYDGLKVIFKDSRNLDQSKNLSPKTILQLAPNRDACLEIGAVFSFVGNSFDNFSTYEYGKEVNFLKQTMMNKVISKVLRECFATIQRMLYRLNNVDM